MGKVRTATWINNVQTDYCIFLCISPVNQQQNGVVKSFFVTFTHKITEKLRQFLE